jgi:hypothetical protein
MASALRTQNYKGEYRLCAMGLPFAAWHIVFTIVEIKKAGLYK